MSLAPEILSLIERERLARKEAERLLEFKSKELHEKKLELEILNSSLENEVKARTEKIKKREDQLSALFNHHPFPSIVYDIDTYQVLTVNNTALEMYGYTQDEFCNLSIFDLHPEKERTKLEHHLEEVREGKSHSRSWTHKLKNGNLRMVQISGNAIEFGDKNARIVTIEDITEKTKIQNELFDQQRQFRDLVEKTSDVIYRTNIHGDFIYVNPNCERISGYSNEELLKMNFIDLIADSYKERVSNFYNYQSERGIATTTTEFPIKSKSGNEVWIEQTVDLIPSLDDNYHQFVSVARDITEKRTLEKNLLRSEEKYRSIIENMELGLLEVDLEDKILKAYPKFCQLTGYSEKELIGKVATEIFLDDDMLDQMSKEKAKRKTGTANVYEIQLKRKDGSKIWVMISGAPYYDERNKIVGSVGVHLDITARKEIESQLVLLSQFPELNPYPVFRFGLQNNELIYANRHAKQFLTSIEFDSEDSEWKRWLSFLNGTQNVFSEFIWQNRTYRFNRVTEQQLGIINIYSTDITEIKGLQNELRTAKEKAEILSNTKDLFLANMSHEIRTPMNAIIGLTEVLYDSELNPFQSKTLQKVRSASDNLLHLINEILDLSKIESNSFELNPTYDNLEECIRQSFELFENEAAKKDVELLFKSDLKNDALYYFDRNRLNQVISNLLSNALKFTERGHVTLKLIQKEFDNQTDEILVSVADSGIGIPSSDLKSIFENFNQAKNNLDNKFGGTGLGLSIAKKILELMDSKLEVESTVGEGSIFSFRLELTKKKTLTPTKESVSLNHIGSLQNKRILIAEDNQTNQFLLKTILEKVEANVTIASNGMEALEILENNDFDMILMDMRMPVLDGIETTWSIRNKLNKTEVPIIALTANTSDKDRRQCLEAGMNDFIVKPFKPKELLELLQNQFPNDEKDNLMDIDKLNNATFNDIDFRSKMISIFIAENEKRTVELESFLKQKKSDKIKSIVHSAKPALHHLSTERMVMLADEIENMEFVFDTVQIERIRLFISMLTDLISQLKSFSQNEKI